MADNTAIFSFLMHLQTISMDIYRCIWMSKVAAQKCLKCKNSILKQLWTITYHYWYKNICNPLRLILPLILALGKNLI